MSRDKKYWQRRFGDLKDVEAYYHHLDLRRIDDLDDEGFAYLLGPVRGINMLDLNETEITNESIKTLTNLEYVTELRVKGCRLDNGCIDDLARLNGLELLHIKNTAITIDGLLKLPATRKLKTLLFSAEDTGAIHEKLLQLKARFPSCEFIIDGKTYYFDNVERFLYAARSLPCKYRLKIKEQVLTDDWSDWITKPSDSYYETEKQGPYPANEIECIEMNLVELRQEGVMMPLKEIDHSEQLMQLLDELAVPYMPVDDIIRIYITDQRTA